jgi:hypothetical protein
MVEQSAEEQPVDERRAGPRCERLPVGVGSVWIGREVMIERNVLLEDDDQVPNLPFVLLAAPLAPISIVPFR